MDCRVSIVIPEHGLCKLALTLDSSLASRLTKAKWQISTKKSLWRENQAAFLLRMEDYSGNTLAKAMPYLLCIQLTQSPSRMYFRC